MASSHEMDKMRSHGDKVHAVLMKATELIHLFAINLETVRYFSSHFFGAI